jgi:hypothetical protein
MFANIRSYVAHNAPVAQLAGIVEGEFADRIAAQPGFVWYALLDSGGSDLVTISVFEEQDQAAGSRELARRWTEERLSETGPTLTEVLNGAIPVSRAAPGLLEQAPARFAGVRRYRLANGDLGEFVWRVVDTRLAERIAEFDGFVAYFVFGSRTGELLTVSVFRDRATAAVSDELALAFMRDELNDLQIGQTDTIGGGEIVVSRVTEALLEPIHA